MKKIIHIFVILLVSFASGCEYDTSEIVESEVLHEDAEVVDVVYTPSTGCNKTRFSISF